MDEPVKLGGKGLGEFNRVCAASVDGISMKGRTQRVTPLPSTGPNPLSLLLGSLVGCTQYTCSMIAKEMKLGGLGAVAWSAAGACQGWWERLRHLT